MSRKSLSCLMICHPLKHFWTRNKLSMSFKRELPWFLLQYIVVGIIASRRWLVWPLVRTSWELAVQATAESHGSSARLFVGSKPGQNRDRSIAIARSGGARLSPQVLGDLWDSQGRPTQIGVIMSYRANFATDPLQNYCIMWHPQLDIWEVWL